MEIQAFESARLGSGNYEMDLRGHEVREAIDNKSCFMGDRGFRACSETSHDEVLEGRGWKAAETIDATRCFEEVALFDVVAYEVAAKAQLMCLGSAKVTTLAFGEFIEALAIRRHVS